MSDAFDSLPEEIIASSGRPELKYKRLPDHFAVIDGNQIKVSQGQPQSQEAQPVYSLSPGTFAVPTGRIFIRFPENVRAETRSQEIETAGYQILQIPPHAPHTAWLASKSGSLADSLLGLARLPRIEGVENVEAQMLTSRAKK